MASTLSCSSLSTSLRRTPSVLSFGARTSSFGSSYQYSKASFSYFSTQSQPIRHRRSQSSSSPLLNYTQCRSITTRLPKPFARSKANRDSNSLSTNSHSTETVTAPPLPLTNLPYFIRRTPSNQLPIYLVTKAGGTRQETKVQKTEGDVDALRNDLIRALGMEKNPSDVVINRLNGHIVIKGWRKPEIQQFLLDRKF